MESFLVGCIALTFVCLLLCRWWSDSHKALAISEGSSSRLEKKGIQLASQLNWMTQSRDLHHKANLELVSANKLLRHEIETLSDKLFTISRLARQDE